MTGPSRAVRRRALGVAVFTMLALCCTSAAGAPWAAGRSAPLRLAGVSGVPGAPVAVTLTTTAARFIPGSSVLAHPGDLTAAEQTEVDAGRSWLARGTVPGSTSAQRALATRALLDLRLLTSPDGATVASPTGPWAYVWPRDAAFVSVAFAATGHGSDAAQVLRWVAAQQRADGTWPARSHPDGSGPVLDGRADQLDATGWFPWAVWVVGQQWRVSDPAAADAFLRALAPAVGLAARAAAARIGADGMPASSPDYWEGAAHGPTLGTAAPLLAGLRAAAQVARLVGEPSAYDLARDAAQRLGAAVQAHWVRPGATRGPDGRGGVDASVVWLARPFSDSFPTIDSRVRAVARRLSAPSGGELTGSHFYDAVTAWTPATGAFALAAAARGDDAGAQELVTWFSRHTTSLGSLPEKVDGLGHPASVAPLGWTDALVLMAMSELQAPLPVPPAT